MIEKTVKTLYGNLVSVQGKYIQQSLKKKLDLKLNYQSKSMIVACSQLDKPIKTTQVPDKFTKKMNTLYYYEWKPIDQRQGNFLNE
tara:strand:- start:1087 stop:1344 length:258 start_codon:yes stop_codon:yes gene_type:complete